MFNKIKKVFGVIAKFIKTEAVALKNAVVKLFSKKAATTEAEAV